jgi:hypothetical protein
MHSVCNPRATQEVCKDSLWHNPYAAPGTTGCYDEANEDGGTIVAEDTALAAAHGRETR